ncbi:MAG TPA: YcgL domain-containing protein [Gammaproteobacteria bacterium]|nr:YcgL domain-containing protein [Gammaproteobacteria bacterium]
MRCVVYKSLRREGCYLYVSAADELEPVPATLLQALGTLEKVMELELEAGRPLARADAAEVMRRIGEQGYFLQMPPCSGCDPLSS